MKKNELDFMSNSKQGHIRQCNIAFLFGIRLMKSGMVKNSAKVYESYYVVTKDNALG